MSNDLYRRIADATARFRDLTGTAARVDPKVLALQQAREDAAPLKGEKPIPKRKRRFHAKAEERAMRRWDGAQKMLELLEPAGVRHDARAMDTLTRKYGI